MKTTCQFFLVVIFLVITSSVFAGEPGGDSVLSSNDLQQGQKQGQDQLLINAPQSNNNTAIGSMPSAYTHPIETPNIPLNSYGHHVNQLPINVSINVLREIGISDYNTFERITRKMSGDKAFEKIREKTRPRPVIVKTFPATGIVYFVDNVPKGGRFEILGILTYDSEKDKKWPVLPQEIQMFCARDAMELGGNIAMPLDQFFRAHFLDEGQELTLAGLLTILGLSTGTPIGGAVTPHGGVANGHNVMIGEAGASFALIRAENPIELIKTPIVSVAPPDDEITGCVKPGASNTNLRIEDAKKLINKYNTDGDKVSLRRARDTLQYALDHDRPKGDQLRTIYEMMASINMELGKVVRENEKLHYKEKAIYYMNKSGTKSIRTIDEY